MKLLLLLLVSVSAFAGNSLTLTTDTASNGSVAAQGANTACRMEVMLHGVDASPTNYTHSGDAAACGFNWQWLVLGPTDIRIQLYSERITGGSVCQILGVQDRLSAGFYIRFQLVPSGAGGEQRCQAWDIDGNRFYSATQTYTGTSGSNSNGVSITGAGTAKNLSWGFYKLFTSNVGLQARMPVHGEDGDLLSWLFDSNLNDSSGNSYTAAHSGTPSYTSTPGQTLISGVVKTNPAPTWTDRRTLRVGVTNAMDASTSFSQADGDYTVTCSWSLLSSTPVSLSLTITNGSTCTPTLNPASFGDYLVRVALTDANMTTANSDVHIGAANMNAAGVIQPTDANVTKIFGPMIALGWNPWALADERHVYAHTQRRAAYTTARQYAPSYSYGNPEWDTAQTGTVAYTWNGKGNAAGGTGTTLSSGISDTATSIPIVEASVLDLSSLPTKIQITSSSGAYTFEEIDICSTTATSGAATLTVCYDGRGKDDASSIGAVLGPTTWSGGAVVGQSLIKGTSTDFVGGSEKLCEAGAGPMGPITYSTGTVSVTAGSASITGSGTTWNTGNGVWAGYAVRIEGTYSMGTPFVFYAYITSVDSTTGITMNRVFPSDADTASGLTYQIVRPFYRFPVTGFTRDTYGGTGLIVWGGTSCISDTQAFFNAGYVGHDVAAYNGDSISGQTSSFVDWDNGYLNVSSTGGVNFYGEDMAWYALHFRSGLAEPKTTAEMISDHWARYPFLRGGVSGPVYSPLFEGGGVIGGITCLVLDADCGLAWSDIRGYLAQGEYHALNSTCASWDTRDGGYLGDWLAMGSVFDPDTGGFRAQWRAALDDLYTLENGCKGGDNSWANGFYHNLSGGSATLTNGSTAVTGSGFSAGYCLGVASGNFSISGNTVTATSGTFSATSANRNIVLNDGTTRLFTAITYTDSTHVTLHSVWTGASTGTWMQTEGQGGEYVGMTAWGESASDADLQYNIECIYNSPTSLTFERNWPGNTATHYRYTANLAGKGQQPYMLAIKAFGFQIASELDATLSTDFASLRDAASTWVANTGYDSASKGMRYGAVFQSCEPSVTAVGTNAWKQPGCSYGLDGDSQRAARMLNGESARAFLYNTTDTNTRATDAYAALWCSSTYNDATLYPSISSCDAAAPGDTVATTNLSDGSFQGGKWSGFFFGMGMGHQWPAQLLTVAGDGPHLTGNPRIKGAPRF